MESNALALSPKKSTDLVEEEIDPRILSLLGLEDVFDLTYEEYQILLKEKAVQARMSNSGISTEDAELVTNEYKRVKGKTGSFKVKSKVNIDKVMNRKTPSPQKVQLDPKKLLPASQDDQKTEVSNKIVKFLNEDLSKNLEEINNKLTDILTTIKEQDKFEKKEKEKKRRKTEVDKKSKREAELEGSAKKANGIFQRIAKPFVSFFDRIRQFFMSILIGSALNFLLSVFKNPAIILNPLKNLANGIVGFLNSIVSFLWNFFVSPINFVITSINSGIKGLISQINNAINLIPGSKPIASPQIPTIPGPPQIPTPFPIQQQEGGGPVINVGDISFESGGQIKKNSGIKISGFGKDDRLIAAQQGEVMMSNAAGDFWGRENLLAMNAMAGGTNKPKIGKMGITAMQGGGLVANKGLPSRGILITPGHFRYGGGTTGSPGSSFSELQANRVVGMRIVELVRKMNPTIPIRYFEHSQQISDSNQGLRDAANYYKGLEAQGYEVLEIHHDQPGGKAGLIPSDNVSPIGAALASMFGNFGKNYRNGLAMPKRGVDILEMRDLSGSYQQGLQRRDLSVIDTTAKKAAQAIVAGYGGTRRQISPPTARSGITPLPIPVGAGTQGSSVPASSSTPNQAPVPSFSSEDPNNMTTLVVKAIYNVVG